MRSSSGASPRGLSRYRKRRERKSPGSSMTASARMLSAIKYLIENTLQKTAPGSVSSQLQSLGPIIPLIQNAIEEVRQDPDGPSAPHAGRPRHFSDAFVVLPGVPEDLHGNSRRKGYPGGRERHPGSSEDGHLSDPAGGDEQRREVQPRDPAEPLVEKKKDEGIELVIKITGWGSPTRERSYPGRGRGRGFGLTSMRERAELSGGSFSLESGKGSGTRVRAAWRLKGSQAGTKN